MDSPLHSPLCSANVQSSAVRTVGKLKILSLPTSEIRSIPSRINDEHGTVPGDSMSSRTNPTSNSGPYMNELIDPFGELDTEMSSDVRL